MKDLPIPIIIGCLIGLGLMYSEPKNPPAVTGYYTTAPGTFMVCVNGVNVVEIRILDPNVKPEIKRVDPVTNEPL